MQARMILFLALYLIIIPNAIAVWDPKPVKFSEGFSEGIGPYLVRIDEIEPATKTAMVTVSRKGMVLGSGPVSSKTPFVLSKKVMIALDGFSKAYSYGAVVNTNVSLWIDARIASWKFPKTMTTHNNVQYNAYLVVENTGSAPATFQTEIVQAGIYQARSDRYEMEDGELVPRVLNLDLPFRTVNVHPGEATRTDYNEITADYRQTRGWMDLDAPFGINMNLYYKGTLLDSVNIPDFSITSGKTAGILDLLIPDTMSQDNEYEAIAVLLNDGLEESGVSSKFNLELKTKGFEIMPTQDRGLAGGRSGSQEVIPPTLMRGNLVRGTESDWNFRINPHVDPGKYTLTFVLSSNTDGTGVPSELDRVIVPVEIRKGFTTRIESVSKPENIEYNKNIQLTVTINNAGIGRMVSLKLTSPVLEEPLQKVIKLPGYQNTQTVFDVPALTTGKVTFDAELFTHYSFNNKNFDPSGADQYLLDSKTISVGIKEPVVIEEKQEEEQVKEEMVVEPVKIVEQTQPEPTPPVETPPITPTSPAPQAAQIPYPQYIPWVLIGIAALLLIVGIKIIWDAYSTEDDEEDMPRQKKRR